MTKTNNAKKKEKEKAKKLASKIKKLECFNELGIKSNSFYDYLVVENMNETLSGFKKKDFEGITPFFSLENFFMKQMFENMGRISDEKILITYFLKNTQYELKEGSYNKIDWSKFFYSFDSDISLTYKDENLIFKISNVYYE